MYQSFDGHSSLLLLLNLSGKLELWQAIIVDIGSLAVVVVNGLRPLRFQY